MERLAVLVARSNARAAERCRLDALGPGILLADIVEALHPHLRHLERDARGPAGHVDGWSPRRSAVLSPDAPLLGLVLRWHVGAVDGVLEQVHRPEVGPYFRVEAPRLANPKALPYLEVTTAEIEPCDIPSARAACR